MLYNIFDDEISTESTVTWDANTDAMKAIVDHQLTFYATQARLY